MNLPPEVRARATAGVRDVFAKGDLAVHNDNAKLLDALITAVLSSLGPELVVVPREPGSLLFDSDPYIFAFVLALHFHVHEADHPQGWSDFSDDQRERLKAAYRAMIAAVKETP